MKTILLPKYYKKLNLLISPPSRYRRNQILQGVDKYNNPIDKIKIKEIKYVRAEDVKNSLIPKHMNSPRVEIIMFKILPK